MNRRDKITFLENLMAGKVSITDLPGASIMRHWYGYGGDVWHDANGTAVLASQIIVGRNIFNIFHLSSSIPIASNEEEVDLSEWRPVDEHQIFNIKHFIQ